MSKAILIMDMPSSCNVCQHCRVYVRKRSLISVCNLLPFSRINKEKINERQEFCPLRECPTKQDENAQITESDYYRTQGYNACIDEILGGGE